MVGTNIPIIYSYLKKYQENPGSRVFAPLAEAYRKAGLIDEAIEVAREGLQVHPTFIGGRVALARALFDKGLYEEVLRELISVIREVPDNLLAQRLVADSNLLLGRLAEALGAYKMLLYFNPSDAETAKLVAELENESYENGRLVLQQEKSSRPQASSNIPRLHWINKVEKLQGLLLKIEKYKSS